MRIALSLFLAFAPVAPVQSLFANWPEHIPSESHSRLRINHEEIIVELAWSEEKRARGLMGRSSLSEGTGMLFIFERPQILSFWMKNTSIPLSIGFFDENGCLVNIEDMDPPKSGELRIYKSKKPSIYALEVPQGWFDRHQIRPPMRIEKIAPP